MCSTLAVPMHNKCTTVGPRTKLNMMYLALVLRPKSPRVNARVTEQAEQAHAQIVPVFIPRLGLSKAVQIASNSRMSRNTDGICAEF